MALRTAIVTKNYIFTAETQRRGEEKGKKERENAEGAEVTLRYPDAAVY